MKNIYFCHFNHEDCGLFVIAPTRGKAKILYATEIADWWDDDIFLDVRSNLRVKGIPDTEEDGVLDIEEPRLCKYGLKYSEVEE